MGRKNKTSRTAKQLTNIPSLALQAYASKNHPWRGTIISDHRCKPDQAPAPTDLNWLVVFDPGRGVLNQLAALAATIHNQLPTPLTPNVPNPAGWQSVCQWLINTEPAWQKLNQTISKGVTQADTIKDAINQAWGQLDQLVGHQYDITPSCPQCGLKLAFRGDTLMCPLGHRYRLEDELKKLELTATATTSAICDLLGCTPRQLHSWAEKGYIQPAPKQGWERRWVIQEALTCWRRYGERPAQRHAHSQA